MEAAKNYRVESEAIVTDSFPLELLSHWCICAASHKDLNGYNSAIDILKEFIINVQNLRVSGNFGNLQLKGLDSIPQSLVNFLQEFTVPYLVQSDAFTNKFSKYIRLGKSSRLANSSGWDVNFDMFDGNRACKGFIECKLRVDAFGMSDLLSYYKKALTGGHKVSFVVAKKHLVSLCHENASKIFDPKTTKESKRLEITPQNEEPAQKKPKSSTKKVIDYAQGFRDLWENSGNHINLYSVVYDQTTAIFKFNTIKEFEKPVGVFLLIGTNFEPPAR